MGNPERSWKCFEMELKAGPRVPRGEVDLEAIARGQHGGLGDGAVRVVDDGLGALAPLVLGDGQLFLVLLLSRCGARGRPQTRPGTSPPRRGAALLEAALLLLVEHDGREREGLLRLDLDHRRGGPRGRGAGRLDDRRDEGAGARNACYHC